MSKHLLYWRNWDFIKSCHMKLVFLRIQWRDSVYVVDRYFFISGNFCFSFVFGYRNVTTTYMFIIVEYIKTHTVVLWFAVYSVRVLARRKHHGRFGAKVLIVSLRVHVHNAMFIIVRVADSRFSHGRRQWPCKSVQWAKPWLTFCWYNLLWCIACVAGAWK